MTRRRSGGSARASARSWRRPAATARCAIATACSRACRSGVVTRDYLEFPAFTAEQGRLISPTEVDRNRAVALLGWDTADRLFGQADPLDRTIKIQGVHFRVVGVSEPTGSSMGRSQDEFAVIPLGRFSKLFGSRQSLTLMARPTTPEQLERAMDDATIALRIERQLRPAEDDNFGLFTSDTVLAIYEQATTGIFAVIVGIVGLSLVVGGIVIMNIMLMVVSERTRRDRVAQGVGRAQARTCCGRSWPRSVTLSVLGGLIGTGLGFGVALTLSALTPVPAAVQLWSVVLGVSMTAVVGLCFGIYPAARAARARPDIGAGPKLTIARTLTT